MKHDRIPHHAAMVYENNRWVPIAVAGITGLMAAANGAVVLIAGAEAPWFLGLVSIGLLLVAAAAATYKHRVFIDRQRETIDTVRRLLLWTFSRVYRVADFDGVGITMGGGGSNGRQHSVYFVQLLGSRNVSIPGTTSSLAEARSKAHRIGEFLSIPVDDLPRAGWFGKRL